MTWLLRAHPATACTVLTLSTGCNRQVQLLLPLVRILVLQFVLLQHASVDTATATTAITSGCISCISATSIAAIVAVSIVAVSGQLHC
jgi:hypothetical protein